VKRFILLLCTIALVVPLALAQRPRLKIPAPTDFEIVGRYAIWDSAPIATQYDLRWRPTHISPWIQTSVRDGETKYRLDGVPLNHEHTFEVRAFLAPDVYSDWVRYVSAIPVPPPEIPRPVLRFDENMKWDAIEGITQYHLQLLGCDGKIDGSLTVGTTYRPTRQLPSYNIAHVLQVRARGDGSTYKPESDWSAPFILCADDLIPPPTPTAFPAGYETETPLPPAPPPTDIPIEPPYREESRPGCFWVGDFVTDGYQRVDRHRDGTCYERISSRITREEQCNATPGGLPRIVEVQPRSFFDRRVDCSLQPPANFKVVNDVALWDAVPGVSGYRLNWRVGDNRWTTIDVPATQTIYRLGDDDRFDRNRAYKFAIQAVALTDSTQSDSLLSPEITATLPLLDLAVPSGFEHDAASKRVSWQAVDNAIGYTVSVFRCDVGSNTTNVLGRHYHLGDPVQNVYRVGQVRSIYDDGHLGPWSHSLVFCNIEAPPLAVPTGLQVTAGVNSFTWQVDPVSEATGYVVGYRVAGSTAASDSTVPYTEVASSTHTGTVDGLAANTQYQVRVRATNVEGESGDTASIVVTTLSPTQPPPNQPDPDPDPDPTARPTARPTSRPQPPPQPTEPPVTCSPRGGPWVQSWTERKGPERCQHARRCSVTLQQYECTDGRRYNQRIGSPSCGEWYFEGSPSCPR